MTVAKRKPPRGKPRPERKPTASKAHKSSAPSDKRTAGKRDPRTPAKGERSAPKGDRRTAPKGERSAPKGDRRTAPQGERAAPKADRRTAGRRDSRTAAKRDGARPPLERALTPRPAQTPRPLGRELSAEPHPGQFLLTTRQGSEQDLIDELLLLRVDDPRPRIIAPALVLAPKVPKRDKRPVELTFARQGFPILVSARSHDPEELATRVARSLRGQLERAPRYALQVWVPDSDLGNPLSELAGELETRIATKLQEYRSDITRVDDATLRRIGSLPLAQVCLIDPERAVAGVTYSNAAISLAPGGRTRVRITGGFPSRAARKLEEALAWLGVEPAPGDLCVDLGAAPGGWTYVLAERRARVIAVDPAKLRPEVLARRGVRHLQESAFTFAPEVPVDWLLCDMAWRPLEAAALLAKWGRKHWARMLVANIKLPMKRKAEMVARVRQILESEGGWKHLRTKQLYHDRDEITVTAHLG